MSRRRLIGAALLAALPIHAPHAQQRGAAPAPAPAPRPLTAADRAVLGQVEAYLNGLRTIRARFVQIAQNGASAQGTAWIVRPGRMRFDYDPPEPMLLVASGGQVMMYDRELGQPSTVPASSTPLGLLLRDQIRLSGDITVTAVERRGGFLHVTMHRTGSPAEGRLTLSFEETPMQLRQWTVVDAQGRATRVTLYEIDTTVRPNLRMFDFNDPRFLEELRR
ncbi:outer membrane lipoprotein carrier protein LolA [Roseomonas sp. AR75]|jgi:outer membrane lipoprotein-sorting protein|uniref:LolA family protein n=1 Tax=Roseomonas sp. AR75 TaxID=2562311 RepID=UPI0010C07C2E|nr:outer membrane lipoprotein carrier protein LolA [Roseomonas sp. AR75]